MQSGGGCQVGDVQGMLPTLRLSATQNVGDREGRVGASPGGSGLGHLGRGGGPPLWRRTDIDVRRRTHLDQEVLQTSTLVSSRNRTLLVLIIK